MSAVSIIHCDFIDSMTDLVSTSCGRTSIGQYLACVTPSLRVSIFVDVTIQCASCVVSLSWSNNHLQILYTSRFSCTIVKLQSKYIGSSKSLESGNKLIASFPGQVGTLINLLRQV